LVGGLVCAGDPLTSYDLGFIASRHADVNGDWRTRGLGPLLEWVRATNDMELAAYRPFYSEVEDPASDRSLFDVAWPLATSRTVQDENQWRALFFFGFNHTTNDPNPRSRTWLFPFYFQGRDAEGKTYRALFPLAGTLKDFVGRDEITWVLWPLYSTSALNDLSTVNLLWPFISRTTSARDHIYRARVFPFYGVNRHRGKFDKRFILWPFYTEVNFHYARGHGGGFILFPLYGQLKLDTETTRWFLPPFFRFTRGEHGAITYAPWPFFQRRTTAEIDLLYLWPLWGRKSMDAVDQSFYLWPVFWTETQRRTGTTTKRFIAAPVFSHAVTRPNEPIDVPFDERPAVGRKHKLWPLYSYRREGEASFFRTLALWPFADSPSIERNWAPLWSLYTRQSNGDSVDHEILWGLYRDHRRGDTYRYISLFPLFERERDERVDPPVRRWNILKGLIGYRREGDDRRLRLLYLLSIKLNQESPPSSP
jgi:hypothetical protein